MLYMPCVTCFIRFCRMVPNSQLSFMSWNVKGLNNVVKKKKVMSFIKGKKIDVILIQETHLSLLESQRLGAGWVGYVGANGGTSRSRGVAILINRHLQFKCIKQSKDEEGRLLAILCDIQGSKIIIANVYAPNIDDPSFFGQLEKKLLDLGDHPIVLAGDFNEVMDTTLDRSSMSDRVSKAHTALIEMSKACGLVDVWRLHNPSGRDFTFYSSPHGSFSRIDFFLISQSLMPSVTSSNIGNIILSDHSPVYFNMMAFTPTVRTPRWRLNSSLLLDEAFKESVRSQINLYIETNIPTAPSAGVAWEALKSFLRGHIIQHAAFKKKDNLKKLGDLEKEIQVIESSFKTDPSSITLNKLTKLKYDYNTIISQKVEFNLFRARQKYFEEGDKAGKLLARYIKQRETMNAIPVIRDGSGQLSSDPYKINAGFSEYYQNLYSSESITPKDNIKTFLTALNLPKVTEHQLKDLDLPITIEEIVGVIKHLPTSKAPGLDGFTSEFYKSFSQELAPLLLNTYNESFNRKILPPSLSEAIITVILKKDKDPSDCKNYRPISLTSYDGKILSKILANRLDRIVTSLIHSDQVGFMRLRSSTDNIRRLIDIMWAVRESQVPLTAISLDAEKAFDRVEWEYLFATLECYGFSDKFITWIRLIYTHPTACVLTNGLMGPSFELGRGTRQGDPLSPLLFALALEPLAIAIRKDRNFPGINIGHSCHKLMLYADDILLFVSDPVKSLPTLLSIIDTFSKISGYKVNWSKSEALPLSACSPKSMFPNGMFSWPQKGIKYLGIIFPPKLTDLMKINIEPLLDQMKTDVERWNQLFLSMWGRVNIIKMVCTPKFNYLLQTLPVHVPMTYFKQFNKLCNLLIWNKKRPRLGLHKLQRTVDRGGLGVPNLLYYYYAFSLRHLAHWFLPPERAPPWFPLETTACLPFTPLNYLSINMAPHNKSHPVLSHIKEVWGRLCKILKFNQHLNGLAGVWHNPKLCIDKAPFFWKSWFSKGIKVLGDLYKDGSLKSFESLIAEFNLSRQDFWRYLQIRHLLGKVFGSFSSDPLNCAILQDVKKVFGAGHEASVYYRMLLSTSDPNGVSLKTSWEKDLNLIITEEEWDAILKNVKKVSRELRTRLVQFKILQKIYWTPQRLHRLGLSDSPACWKCQQEGGTLVHVLWECPEIQKFWSSIHKVIQKIVGQSISFCGRLYILGDPSILSHLPSPLAQWTQTTIMMGRKLIVKDWKGPSVPSFSLWHSSLSQLAALERLSYRLLNKENDFHNKWSRYFTYINSKAYPAQ